MKSIPVISLLCLFFISGCSGKPPVLGVTEGLLTQCPNKPNCVSSQAKDEAHFIEPIMAVGMAAQIKDQLLTTLKVMEGGEVKVAGDDYIRAEFTSSLFRFVDDVEFYFPQAEQGQALVHVRSASRVGYSDLGVNRTRIEAIRSQLSQ